MNIGRKRENGEQSSSDKNARKEERTRAREEKKQARKEKRDAKKAEKAEKKTAKHAAAETEDAAAEAAERICPKCGNESSAGSVYCPQCGTLLFETKKSKRKRGNAKKDMKRAAGNDAVPCTNDLAGFRFLFEDGVAETEEGVFCQTMKFGDISYENERVDVKDDIFEKFAQLHASFPAGTCYQMNMLNIPELKRNVERYLPEEGPDVELAKSYNRIIEDRQRKGRMEFDRPNYLTFSVVAEDDREAARKLHTLAEAASIQFNRINVKTQMLDGMEKAELIHKMLVGPGSPLLLDYERLRKTKREHVRDYVAPAWAAYPQSERFEHKAIAIPGRLVKSYHIRDFGNDLSDRALRTIRALPIPMNISLLFRPQPKSESVKTLLRNIDVVQAEMLDYSRSVARSGGDPTLMPPALENKEAESREQLDFIQERDQTVSWFQGIITVWAENAEKLAEYEDMIMSEKGNWTLDIVEMPERQEPALTGALPLATPRLHNAYRSLTTAEGSALIPFVSQNIHDDPHRSYLIGVDRISGDAILVNPDGLKSPHAWLFGITGGGKSMQINSILSYSLLQNPRTKLDDDTQRWVNNNPKCPQWHIFDFHEEYTQLGKLFDGEISYFGPGHMSSLNPMDMSDAEGDLTLKNVRENTDFFLALFESMMDRRLTQREMSTIDTCLNDVFAPLIGTKERPTLVDLYNQMREHAKDVDDQGMRTTGAKVAEELADSLAMYVTGSMNSFAAHTNVKISNHLNIYVMSELGNTMQTLAMMSAIQHVRKCTYSNYAKGKPTYLIIEECQILFDNEAAVRVLESLFAEMRKYGLHIICVTQLPNRVLSHPRAVNLFENSGLFIFLPQQAENAETISSMFMLSATQAEALSLSSDVGTGLVIADGVKIAFRNTIPKDTYCYEVWNTDPDRNARLKKEATDKASEDMAAAWRAKHGKAGDDAAAEDKSEEAHGTGESEAAEGTTARNDEEAVAETADPPSFAPEDETWNNTTDNSAFFPDEDDGTESETADIDEAEGEQPEAEGRVVNIGEAEGPDEDEDLFADIFDDEPEVWDDGEDLESSAARNDGTEAQGNGTAGKNSLPQQMEHAEETEEEAEPARQPGRHAAGEAGKWNQESWYTPKPAKANAEEALETASPIEESGRGDAAAGESGTRDVNPAAEAPTGQGEETDAEKGIEKAVDAIAAAYGACVTAGIDPTPENILKMMSPKTDDTGDMR